MMTDDTEYKRRIKQALPDAQSYKQRPPHKHAAEMRLVERAFALIPDANTVLDIPCGAGRVAILLARRGYRSTGAELGAGMIEVARAEVAAAGLDCPIEQQDVERMSYADRQFGAVICFRLFHHFPTVEVRRRVVAELCRVAGDYVALSYFSPWSLTSLKRRLRAALGGKTSRQQTTPLAEVRAYFAEQGFELVQDFAQTPLIHTLHLAVFKRRAA